MKKSHRILQALSDSAEPLTAEEIAAAIDEPDEAKSVGVLLCHQRNQGRVEQVDKQGLAWRWTVTSAGQQFLADVLAEEQDTGTNGNTAARRVMAAERARRDPDGPPPPREAPRRQARAPAMLPVAPAAAVATATLIDTTVAVAQDGALLVIEGGHVTNRLTPEIALRVAQVVRQLRAVVPA